MPWETANTVTTIVSLAALGSSVGNYVYTNVTAKRARRFQYKLDRWHDLRDDIRKSADALQEVVADIVHVAPEATDLQAAQTKVREIHRKAIAKHLHLGLALNRAERSDYASSNESWADL